MQRLVRGMQRISQKRLKGRPKTIGYTLSQRGTEKHIARKGTIASSADKSLFRVNGPRFLNTGSATIHQLCDRVGTIAELIEDYKAYLPSKRRILADSARKGGLDKHGCAKLMFGFRIAGALITIGRTIRP